MNSRDRVAAVIRHESPDRMPVYGWVSANLTPQLTAAFGSVEAFEDHYEFDYAHLFGGPPTVRAGVLEAATRATGGVLDPPAALDLPFTAPDDSSAYDDLRSAIRHHKTDRGRFVYVQTPGIFEALNGVFGIENHLLYLMLHPDELMEIYRRQAEWNRRFAMNCIDLGVDMVHVSDDWGAQHGLLFSTQTWRDMIYPHHKTTVDAVKARNTFVSLHSDGNVNPVVDGIIELGYDVVHPWQESAGMRLEEYKARWMGKFAVMGGLDIQTTLGFGDYAALEASLRRVVAMFRGGGLLFCTTHFVQDHCTVDELVFAFDLVTRLARDPLA
jgi:uroporphyrinogen decarboxylase